MSWLLKTRIVALLGVVAWLVATTLPVAVPHPTVRAGIQWIGLGAVLTMLPLVLALWNRWHTDAERMIRPVRPTPVILDVALIAAMPLGAAAMAVLGISGSAHAIAPSLSLGALTLIAGAPRVPRSLAAAPLVLLAISLLFGDRPDGGHEPWALATAAQADSTTLACLVVVFVLTVALVVRLGVGRSWRSSRS